jgi:hypothetical protein
LEDIGYIGYKQARVGDLATSGAGAAATTAAAFAQGGLNIGTDIAALMATFQFATGLWDQWTSHPAADALNLISQMKPQLVNIDARSRMALVLATSQKIGAKAKDVDAEKNLLWYRLAYPNDYTILSPDDKIYWNNYMNTIRSTNRDGNNMYFNLQSAMFTTDQINYNATPISAVSNLLSSTGISTNTLIYIAIGLGLYLLIKK